MTFLCPKCAKPLGEVQTVEHMNLIVHCPYCGHDFGVSVPKSEPVPPAAAANPATPAS